MKKNYKEWMAVQDIEFIKEICIDNEITEMFYDFNYSDLTIEALRALDNKHIFNKALRVGEENE